MENQTEAPVSTEAPSSSQSYVQSLIDPAVESTTESQPVKAEATQTPATTDAAVTTPAKEVAPAVADKPAASATPSIDELVQKFANETGLNPNDPAQRKTLTRLAEKEAFILKLQAENESLKAVPKLGDQTEGDLLTEFEKSLVTPAVEAPKGPTLVQPVAETPKPPVADQNANAYNDVGDAWKKPEDSLTDLNAAWAANDLGKVHQIELARFVRNFDQTRGPAFVKFVKDFVEDRLKGFLEKDLGDVVPSVRQSVQEKREGEAREYALDQLRKAGAKDIDSMFTAADGPPITYGGQEFDNTPLNRILAANPEVMNIEVKHSDPVKAGQATQIARFKMAYKLFQAEQRKATVTADTAKSLVQAGADQAKRAVEDRTRQAINAGPGAGAAADGKESYVKTLAGLQRSEGETPFSSLF